MNSHEMAWKQSLQAIGLELRNEDLVIHHAAPELSKDGGDTFEHARTTRSEDEQVSTIYPRMVLSPLSDHEMAERSTLLRT